MKQRQPHTQWEDVILRGEGQEARSVSPLEENGKEALNQPINFFLRN